ncbi:hypothetical protein [uncultured Amphritea sp.]|uniref:hypothetical protein n=1 Tax=uncultured Amphritea sp. TaxID=981605 RepID=UPI002610BF66|nr:hypothetical protein [uncultured Amphritea sp.]
MKYSLIFVLALLAGCSSLMNQPEYKLPGNLTDQEIHPLSCNQFDLCSALYVNYDRPKTLKVAVSGAYHQISGATLWIDNKAYPLTPAISYTRNGLTESAKRISMRPFISETPLKAVLNGAMKVSLETNQQSFSFNTIMKDEGFVHPEWRALLAGFN